MDQEAKDRARTDQEIETRGLLCNYATFLADVHPDISVRVVGQFKLEIEDDTSKRKCTIDFIQGRGWSALDISKVYMTLHLEGHETLIKPIDKGLMDRKYKTRLHTYSHAYLEKGQHGDPDSLEIRGVLLGDISYTRELLKTMVGHALGLRYPTRSIENPPLPPRRDDEYTNYYGRP
jgi:hypothetical protein